MPKSSGNDVFLLSQCHTTRTTGSVNFTSSQVTLWIIFISSDTNKHTTWIIFQNSSGSGFLSKINIHQLAKLATNSDSNQYPCVKKKLEKWILYKRKEV